MNGYDDTKITKAFREYLYFNEIPSNRKLLIFLNFQDFEKMNSFLNDYLITDEEIQNSELEDSSISNTLLIFKEIKIPIYTKYSINPTLLIFASIDEIKFFNKDNRLYNIDYNYPAYLAINKINIKYDIPPIQNSLFSLTGKGINIALIDSGIDENHPDLSNRNIKHFNLTNENDYDLCGHGTMMAGIIVGNGNSLNGKFKGIAPNSNITDVKIIEESGIAYISDVLAGLEIIKNELLDIILIGLCSPFDNSGKDTLSLVLKFFSNKNIKIIAPAGNFGPDSKTIGSPGNSENVICVGTVDFSNKIAFFSSRGRKNIEELSTIKPNIVISGVKIKTTKSSKSLLGNEDRDEIYAITSGTCISSAIFCGILALLLEFDKNISNEDLLKNIKETSSSLFYDNISQGNGTINTIKLFKKFGAFYPPIKSFKYILKRAIFYTLIILIVLILIFYLFSLI